MKLELCFERENIPEEFIKDLKGKENFMSAKIKLVNEFGDEQDLSFYLKLSLVYSDSITPVNSEVQVQNQDALRCVFLSFPLSFSTTFFNNMHFPCLLLAIPL